MSKKMELSAEDKKVFKQVYFQSWKIFMGSDNSGCSASFVLAMLPALKTYYKDEPEKMQEAMKAYFSYFNCNSVGGGLVFGVVLAMEKLKAKGEEISYAAINSVKASLMGPLAGIGDSLFFTALRPVLAAIAISLSAGGNILGPLFFLVSYFGIQAVCKYWLMYAGFTQGSKLIDDMSSNGLMPIITKCAGIVGLMMVGYLIGANMNVQLAFAPVINGVELNIQSILDGVFPGILSLAVWFIVLRVLKKGVKPIKVIFAIIIICVILSLIGIV